MTLDLEGMNVDDKLNPIGSYLLHRYYTSNKSHAKDDKKINQDLFCLNSPRDIPLIMHCAKQAGINQYGMIVVTGGRHRTPVIIDGDECYILESLGFERSIVGKSSVAQIAIAISQYNQELKIHSPGMMRQLDTVSCGTDAFIAIKESLRTLKNKLPIFKEDSKVSIVSDNNIIDKDELKDDYFKQLKIPVHVHPAQPACVSKYIQSISLLQHNRYRLFKANDDETVLEYALRHQKPVGLDTGEVVQKSIDQSSKTDSVVELKKLKMSLTNGALFLRRNKHKAIFEKYKDSLSIDDLYSIIYKASGAKLVTKYAHTVPDELLQKANNNDNYLDGNVVAKFCEQEIHRIRPNDKTAIAQAQTITLSHIVIGTNLSHSKNEEPNPPTQRNINMSG